MVKYKFQKQVVNFKKRNKPSEKLVPDQSISIKDLIDKFTRGVPVEISQREKSFVDQGDDQEPVDLEKLANLSPADRAFAEGELRAEAEALQRRLDEERATVEQAIKEEEEAKRQAEVSERSEGHSESLDNTMPNDTDLTNRQLSGSKKKGRN